MPRPAPPPACADLRLVRLEHVPPVAAAPARAACRMWCARRRCAGMHGTGQGGRTCQASRGRAGTVWDGMLPCMLAWWGRAGGRGVSRARRRDRGRAGAGTRAQGLACPGQPGPPCPGQPGQRVVSTHLHLGQPPPPHTHTPPPPPTHTHVVRVSEPGLGSVRAAPAHPAISKLAERAVGKGWDADSAQALRVATQTPDDGPARAGAPARCPCDTPREPPGAPVCMSAFMSGEREQVPAPAPRSSQAPRLLTSA
jgi:hypothetical protein